MLTPWRKGKGSLDKFQFMYGGFIILVISAYFLVLLAAVADLTFRALGLHGNPLLA
jgi:hypothetical protein